MPVLRSGNASAFQVEVVGSIPTTGSKALESLQARKGIFVEFLRLSGPRGRISTRSKRVPAKDITLNLKGTVRLTPLGS